MVWEWSTSPWPTEEEAKFSRWLTSVHVLDRCLRLWLVIHCIAFFCMIIISVLFRLSLSVKVCWGVSNSGEYGVTFFSGEWLVSLHAPYDEKVNSPRLQVSCAYHLNWGATKHEQIYLSVGWRVWKVLRALQKDTRYIEINILENRWNFIFYPLKPLQILSLENELTQNSFIHLSYIKDWIREGYRKNPRET